MLALFSSRSLPASPIVRWPPPDLFADSFRNDYNEKIYRNENICGM
jgi:hypothetical protein